VVDADVPLGVVHLGEAGRQQGLLRPRRVVDEEVEVGERPEDRIGVESRHLRPLQEEHAPVVRLPGPPQNLAGEDEQKHVLPLVQLELARDVLARRGGSAASRIAAACG
jgi:hypothetical protein